MSEQNKIANPAPLGLIGFGMTTVLLNLHNAGIIHLSMVIIAMGIMLGGLAQIIAGIMEFKCGNTFGATAFTAYGLFWLSLVCIWLLPYKTHVDSISMGFYLFIWFIFTLMMFVGTFKHNFASRLVFGTLALLFLLLSIGDFTEIALIKLIAGYVGIICGILAIYTSIANVLNNEFGRKILPLGESSLI